MGFTFEWNLVRLGYLANNIGDVYVDLRGIGDQSWLNFEIGRFQIPFGENYKRFGRGYYTDPFVALSASPPWFWDEGVKLWGDALEGKVSYVVRDDRRRGRPEQREQRLAAALAEARRGPDRVAAPLRERPAHRRARHRTIRPPSRRSGSAR